MGLAADAYQRMLTALLPPGRLLRTIGASLISQLLLGIADEFSRLDARVDDLQNEADPTTAIELLPEYEAELELAEATSTGERQALITAKTIADQGYKPSDFQVSLAPLLGQVPADVVVLERSHAMADAMGDDREIFRFFVYRDPTLPGQRYIDSAQALVDTIKPSHTIGHVIESVDFLCDDEFSLCDRDLLGA